MDEVNLYFRGKNIRHRLISGKVFYCLKDVTDSLGWSRTRFTDIINKFSHEKKYSTFNNSSNSYLLVGSEVLQSYYNHQTNLIESEREKLDKLLFLLRGFEHIDMELPGKPKKVNVDDLSIKEFKGERVVTFKDIDEVHDRPDGTAKRNFTQNKKRFVEGEDYFIVTTAHKDDFRTLEIPNRGLTVLSESGYLMLVKSFTDDLAWEVQKKLVNTYFRVKKHQEMSLPQSYEEALEHLLVSVKKEREAQKQIEVLSPKAERYEDLMNAENCQDMNEVAKAFKTGRNRLFSYLREQKVIMTDKALPYQKYIEKGYFLVIEVEKNNLIHTKTLVTPLGIDFIAKLLNENPPKHGFFDKVKSLFTKNA